MDRGHEDGRIMLADMTGAVQMCLDGFMGLVRGRPVDDHYETGRWLVDAVLDEAWAAGDPGPATVLDAGCGGGVLSEAVLDRWPGCRMTGVEIDPERAFGTSACPSLDVVRADFLTWAAEAMRSGLRYDLVISNPPFRLWDHFVRSSLPLVASGGTALMLGFVNVLGGQSRAPWWRAHPPSRIWLSPRRASFTPDGQTDPRDCCWIEWGPDGRRSELRWLRTEGGLLQRPGLG